MFGSPYLNCKGLLLAAMVLPGPIILIAPDPAEAQIGLVISVALAPPVLPIYVQPPIPEVGYLWTPGYWAWSTGTGYYWVPGTWVMPPMVGVLWTPPYWGWSNGLYLFHGGYWGEHVGFYGGVNYGYGYGGSGYEGGRWDGGHFAYNQTANNFGSVHVDNAYRQNVTVINNTHVSYNGGAGGVRAEPTPSERAAEHETHQPVTPAQTQHIAAAATHPEFAASHNGGRPPIAATSHPGQFAGAGVVRPQASAAHAVYRPQAAPQRAAPRPVAAHAAPRPAPQRSAPRPAAKPQAEHEEHRR